MPPKKTQSSSTMTNDEKADWSLSNEAAFIHCMLGHVKQGELQCSTFKPKTWLVIDEEMFAKTRKRYGVEKLKSKFNRLRKRHREFSYLIKSAGFGWDSVTNTVTASDEVWDDYIKKHPTSKTYRKKGLEHYDVLSEIFNSTIATGQLDYSLNQAPLDSDDDRAVEEELLNAGVHVEMSEDNDHAHYEGSTSSDLRKRPRRSIDSSSFRGPKIERQKNRTTEDQLYSTDECIKLLKSFGIEPHKFAKLLNKDYLMNFEFRKILMGLEAAYIKAFIDSL